MGLDAESLGAFRRLHAQTSSQRFIDDGLESALAQGGFLLQPVGDLRIEGERGTHEGTDVTQY